MRIVRPKPTQGIGQTYAQFRNYLATHVTSATMQTIVNNTTLIVGVKPDA